MQGRKEREIANESSNSRKTNMQIRKRRRSNVYRMFNNGMGRLHKEMDVLSALWETNCTRGEGVMINTNLLLNKIKECGYSHERLAVAVNCSRSTIHNIIYNRTLPSFYIFVKLIEALELDAKEVNEMFSLDIQEGNSNE